MGFSRTPNQQDLSWFIDMNEQERLDLDPPYQRKSVWTSKDKQEFLDTVFNNYPCPAVYLQKENTEKGPKYNVVDGKQRLSTVLNFYSGKLRISKTFPIAELKGKRFQDLDENYKARFYNYIFTVEQIRSDEDRAVDWSEVFQRVNKNQKTLKEQELRHARFDGWLVNRAEDEIAEVDFWRSIGISSRSRNSRMKDVEFVSILMLAMLEERFVGFPQHAIDELYAKYDFQLEDLPADEAEAYSEEDLEDNGDEFLITMEDIENFETNFATVRSLIEEIEGANECITRHKKRLFTDFYSLWCALSFERELQNKDATEIAKRFDELITEVDSIYEKLKNDQSIANHSEDARTYQANSTGAATESQPRQNRHNILVKILAA